MGILFQEKEHLNDNDTARDYLKKRTRVQTKTILVKIPKHFCTMKTNPNKSQNNNELEYTIGHAWIRTSHGLHYYLYTNIRHYIIRKYLIIKKKTIEHLYVHG